MIRTRSKLLFFSVIIAVLTLGCTSTPRYALPPPPEGPAILVDDPICVSCHLEKPAPASTDEDSVPDPLEEEAGAVLAPMLPPNNSFKPKPLRGSA